MLSDLWSAFGPWWLAHRMEVWVAAVVAALVAGLYLLDAVRYGPRDRSANGIVVGRAKQFDNRSLNLILEELNASLEKLSVVTQSISGRPDVVQESKSTDSSRSLSFGFARSGKGAKSGGEKSDGQAGGGNDGKPEGDSKASGDDAPSDGAESSEKPGAEASKYSPTYGMAAGDLLADQINLAYQITNIRLLNERALSDRLENRQARLQVVLGFQVSINPPGFAKDCVAVTEIELQISGNPVPISVVAMIPQEKTYDAATLSSSGNSMDGSVVSGLLRIGAAAGWRQNAVYLHRDTDTIAFERNPGWYGGPFGSIGQLADDAAAAVFGWEFRPVLGRRSVSPGARWMLAVVSLPRPDPEAPALDTEEVQAPPLTTDAIAPPANSNTQRPRTQAADPNAQAADAGAQSVDADAQPDVPDPQAVDAHAPADADPSPVLGVRAKTYWRRYHRRHQTTSVRRGWWPLPLSGPQAVETPWYELPILRTTDVQESLSPKIAGVSWVDVGGGAAIVLVKGENFFSGTEVTIGGVRYRAGDGKLVLKSERAIEINTTIAALAKGDGVLSGRYGASIPLQAKLPERTTEHPMRPTASMLANGINIDDAAGARIEGADGKFRRLAIPLIAAVGAGTEGGPNDVLTGGIFDYTPQPIICVDDVVIPQPYYYNDDDADFPGAVVARCFAPTETLAGARSVLFKIPFMGSNWAPASAMPEDLVTVDGVGDNTLIFSGARPFEEPPPRSHWVAVIDKEYRLGASGAFVRLTSARLKLTVSSETLATYDKVLLRLAEKSYLLDLPRKAQPPARASLDEGEAPPILKKRAAAIVDLKGAGLTQVSSVRLGSADVPFQVFGGGSRMRLFLADSLTKATGKLDLVIGTADANLAASVYVLDEAANESAAKKV